LALNRPPTEDQAPVLSDDRVAGLFQGLDFTRVDDRAGSLIALIQEAWRLFLLAMLVALLVEAGLCMPRRAAAQAGLEELRARAADAALAASASESGSPPARASDLTAVPR